MCARGAEEGRGKTHRRIAKKRKKGGKEGGERGGRGGDHHQPPFPHSLPPTLCLPIPLAIKANESLQKHHTYPTSLPKKPPKRINSEKKVTAFPTFTVFALDDLVAKSDPLLYIRYDRWI